MATKSVNSKVGGVMLAICLVILVAVVYFERQNLAPYFGMGDGNLTAQVMTTPRPVPPTKGTDNGITLSQKSRIYTVDSYGEYSQYKIHHTADIHWEYNQDKNPSEYRLKFDFNFPMEKGMGAPDQTEIVNCNISSRSSGKDTSTYSAKGFFSGDNNWHRASGAEARKACDGYDTPGSFLFWYGPDGGAYSSINVPGNSLIHFGGTQADNIKSQDYDKSSLTTKINDKTEYNLIDTNAPGNNYTEYTLTFFVRAKYLEVDDASKRFVNWVEAKDVNCNDVSIFGLPTPTKKTVTRDKDSGNCKIVYVYNNNRRRFDPTIETQISLEIAGSSDNVLGTIGSVTSTATYPTNRR